MALKHFFATSTRYTDAIDADAQNKQEGSVYILTFGGTRTL